MKKRPLHGTAKLNAAKTHCKRGHKFTPANTAKGGRGERRCRKCAAWHGRRTWPKRRERINRIKRERRREERLRREGVL